MGYYNSDDVTVFESRITSKDMDLEFRKLYDSLIAYKNNIFRLVDTICSSSDAGECLAMNMAERDSELLQRLVANECDHRRMARKAEKQPINGQIESKTPELTVQKILQLRSSAVKDDPNSIRRE
jgi:hypothetical protein